MKKFKLVITLMLTFALVFGFCACSSGTLNSEEKNKENADVYSDGINVSKLIDYAENEKHLEKDEKACEEWKDEINEEYKLFDTYENYGSQLNGDIQKVYSSFFIDIFIFEYESDAELSVEVLTHRFNDDTSSFETVCRGRIVFWGEKETLNLMIEAAETENYDNISRHIEELDAKVDEIRDRLNLISYDDGSAGDPNEKVTLDEEENETFSFYQ